MADQHDRGLFGLFGKKHEEGSHEQPPPHIQQGYNYDQPAAPHTQQGYNYDQPAPHTQQGYNDYGYGDAGAGVGAGEVYHAPPPAGYNEEMYGVSQAHGKQGEEKSHGLLGKLHRTHSNSSSSSSSDEEDKEGGGRKKKGLKEKIKENLPLPGLHKSKKEGEMQMGEEKKHGLF
ncbi:hypothetical protein KI387_022000 [Taxus chinensis]|uniref:Dehydrin 2 n=1 Tax=Taxus chinensis TaxID=29808 RepID=A0AA38GBQ9_TAXCH|nr:hypothetical protein KI387_022000 [Taxus chinensis]